MEKIYYDGSKAISYNALFNFIIGGRSIGKTYYFKRQVIRDFIKKKKQFIYLRRYKTEFKGDDGNKIESFFDDVKWEFENHNFCVKAGKFYIDGEIAGFYMPLSTSSIFKSVPFPNVATILFDEFIIDKRRI